MAGPNTSVSQTLPGGDDNLKIVSAEQFTNDATSTEEDSKLAIFFDEGLGYLYVRELGTGTEARTQLCHSIADGLPGQHQLEPEEVRFYRPFLSIPRLIDFKKNVFNDGIHGNLQQDVTYWQFCNGGDLENYLQRHESIDKRIPELIIHRFLWQIFKTLHFLYNSRPQVAHRDIFAGNIFLDWKDASSPDIAALAVAEGTVEPFDLFATYPDQEDGRMPDFYLGDFGHATVPVNPRKAYRSDLVNIRECFKKLLLATVSSLDLVHVNKSHFQQRGYSDDLWDIWEYIYRLERRATHQEDLDISSLDVFIAYLGKLAPERTNESFCIGRPVINTAPAFFVSKYQLLANHGNMNGGPWYICRVAANNETTIDSTAYGVPGQEPPEAAGGLRAVNSDTVSPPDGYNEEEDPESDDSDLAVCFAPAFTTVAFAPDPRAAEFNPGASAFTPGAQQGEEIRVHVGERFHDEHPDPEDDGDFAHCVDQQRSEEEEAYVRYYEQLYEDAE